MHFKKKYLAYITRNKRFKGYPMRFEISNPEAQQTLLFFFNETMDYTVYQANELSDEVLQPHGYILARRYYLNKLNIAYHEVELPKMFAFLPELHESKTSFVEQDIGRYFTLPKDLKLEEQDLKQVEEFWGYVERVRDSILNDKQQNLKFDNDYESWLSSNKAVKRVQNTNVENNSSDDQVFSDLEDELENLKAK